jgi:vacuolar-type H+-ATPase subunit H
MNELIQSLQEKIGLTAEQAKDAANHMMEYIKEKVPASMHEHLDLAAMGETILTKGGEILAEAQSKGSDLLHAAQEKISSLLHSKES